MSGIEKSIKNDKIFLKIAEGALRQPVPKGTPGAEERDWQAGGESGTAYELVHNAVFGRIVAVDFFEGEKNGKRFTTLNITLDADEDGKFPRLGVPVGSKYAQDIMKKLPNVNFLEEVRIRPFSFTPDGEDKEITGVEITHRGSDDKFSKKVENYFTKKDGEKWVQVNGFPIRSKPWSEQSEGERKIYRIQVEEFLINYTKENIIPKVAQVTTDLATTTPKTKEQEDRMTDYPVEEIDPNDIPF